MRSNLATRRSGWTEDYGSEGTTKTGGAANRGDAMGNAGDSENLREVFARVRARLKAGVGEDVFNSWFGRLELEEVVDDVVHLTVPTKFLCNWIQSNYADRILDAFKAELPELKRLHFTVRVAGQPRPTLAHSSEASQTDADPAPAPARIQRDTQPRGEGLTGSPLDPRMTFDTFVTGASNEIALKAALQVVHAALNNTVAFNPLYFRSTVGLGKSHLLNAIAWAAGAADSSRNIVYLTADRFMYHFIDAMQRQSALAFKDWLRHVDLLLIDDMQFLQGKSGTEFGHTLGTLLTGAKQVVAAGDVSPRDLEMLDERVRSRLSGGLVVEINGLDLDLRRSIVEKRVELASARFGLHFPSPVIEYIALSVVSHGRDLDGAVTRLVAANQLTNEAITVPLAERTLADLVRSREAKRVRIEDILRIVSRHFKVPRNDLLSSRRSRDVVRPRQIAMYLAKALTSRSLPEIGRRFGGRDHTTVLHSVRKVEQMMKDDGDLCQEIELLKRMLEE